MQLISYSVLCL
uniref:Uncharacterized protein n=1 Tax=Arundo donax TaxID=35708 RepID=A0A0A9F3D1_ARUDO